MIYRWEHLSSPELAERANPNSVAVMALGAIEQHGPHLPLSTDLDIVNGLLERALAALQVAQPVFVLPAMALGASDEHGDFVGTLSLSAAQMSDVLARLGRAVTAAGIRRLVLVNGHGGNIGWMGPAALDLRRRHGMLVVKASYMQFSAPEDLLGAEELKFGLHGGQAETAMMMHLHPERIRSDKLSKFDSVAERLPSDAVVGPESEASWAWLAQDLSPEGVVGRADLATAALGQRLVDFYAKKLTQVLSEAVVTELPAWTG
ncbi:MAG: creatininase family protein [Wenzhouxiangella sp.]|jgi:creatinine amidohydrolase|nr:creatininase family protein [Wenzhouxiangella sp.]